MAVTPERRPALRVTRNPSEALTFPGLSQSVRSGDFIFLSGQCSMDENGKVVGEDDPLAQARQIFRNIESLLAAEGSTLADIVKLVCFVISPTVYQAYAQVKAELFPASGPTGTTVVVKALLDPQFLLEVDATAVRGGRPYGTAGHQE
jgi:enamine deaminase RidA (YjgF/YER057c/UK114 family)